MNQYFKCFTRSRKKNRLLAKNVCGNWYKIVFACGSNYDNYCPKCHFGIFSKIATSFPVLSQPSVILNVFRKFTTTLF